MKSLFFLAWLGLVPGVVLAQSSFEQLPAIPYEQTGDWILMVNEENEDVTGRAMTIPGFFDSVDNLRIQLASGTPGGIRLYRQSALIQAFLNHTGFPCITATT